MSLIIRTMRESDADVIRHIEAIAFGEWWQNLKGPDAPELAQRTHVNVVSRLIRASEGCFVAEENNDPVGFIFSCMWGSVGWFGTFSVLPAHQGRGIGRRLIEASLDYLRQQSARIIGLETMPESPYNLGLYMKIGFKPRLITPILSKPLTHSEISGLPLPRWSAADAETRERWLADLQEATARIPPGFDYTNDIVITKDHDLGETLVMLDGGRAVGLSNVLLQPIRESGNAEHAIIQALALHPAYTDEPGFYALLRATEALARSHGKRAMIAPVNGRHVWALERLLSWGYRVERAMIRMTLGDAEQEPLEDRLVNLSRWAG